MTGRELSADFLAAMTTASRALKASVQRALEASGVHAGQQFILECLWREDGLTPGELASRIGVEVPTITRAVTRMQAAGLVTRGRDDRDARLVRVTLTERGRELEATLPRLLEEVAETALQGLSERQRASLVRSLKQVSANVARGDR